MAGLVAAPLAAHGLPGAAASARESVLAVRGLLRGSLRVGGIPTPGLLDQAALLASFRDHHPAVDIRYVRDTSMAEDLERGNRIEMPWFQGAVVSMGQRAGIPTPANAFVEAALSVYVNGAPVAP